MAETFITLLGTPTIRVDGDIQTVERRKSLGIIAYLAATSRQHRRDELATLFWEDIDQSRALANLRQTLVDMKRVLDGEILQVDRSTMMLSAHPALHVDVRAFNQQLRDYRQSGTVDHLEAMVNAYQGDFMTGFSLPDAPEYDDWQRLETERYRRECLEALDKLARHYQDIGDTDTAIDYAQRLLGMNPLDETVHRLLMRLYVENKQQAEAMTQYMDCVRILRDDLGVDPQPATQKLYDDLLDYQVMPSDTDPLVRVKLPYSQYPPRPPLLIGRRDALGDLKRRIGAKGDTRHAVTVVHGSLGVGKSTLVAEIAHDPDIKVAFPDGVLSVTLGATPDIDTELSNWANVFSIAHEILSQDEITGQLRGIIKGRKMLIILDDIWDAAQTFPFDVSADGSAVLMTTRFSRVARRLAPTPQDIYTLAPLTSADGVRLLGTLSPTADERYPEDLRAISERYQGLPLALQICARLLDEELSLGWGAADMLDDLLESNKIMQAQVPPDIAQRLHQKRLTLAQLIEMTLAPLDDEQAQALQQIATQCNHAPFNLETIRAIWGDPDIAKAHLRALTSQGILTVLGAGQFALPILWVLYFEQA